MVKVWLRYKNNLDIQYMQGKLHFDGNEMTAIREMELQEYYHFRRGCQLNDFAYIHSVQLIKPKT